MLKRRQIARDWSNRMLERTLIVQNLLDSVRTLNQDEEIEQRVTEINRYLADLGDVLRRKGNL